MSCFQQLQIGWSRTNLWPPAFLYITEQTMPSSGLQGSIVSGTILLPMGLTFRSFLRTKFTMAV